MSFNNNKIMFAQLSVLSALLFILAGCVYNDEPTPEIMHDYGLIPKIIYPAIVAPPPTKTVDYSNIPARWFPTAYLENKSRWQGIVIHHSANSYGSASHEHKYHKSKGWDGLGYHFVINNGIYKNGYGRPDGVVEVGYRWRGQKDGAHCRPNGDRGNYWNKHTIGICLVGDFEKTHPSRRQRRALVKLVKFLQQRYNIPTTKIKAHNEIKPTACPGKKFSTSGLKAALNR